MKPSAGQRELFAADRPDWEEDDKREALLAEVIFSQGPRKPFDYLVPEAMQATLEAGKRVRVPFGRGNRSVIGYCVAVKWQDIALRRGLKSVSEILDEKRLLSPAMLKLTTWMADYYLCGWGQVLDAVVPSGVRSQAGTREITMVSLARKLDPQELTKLPAKQMRIAQYLGSCTHSVPATQVLATIGCTQAPLQSLRKKGLIATSKSRVATDPFLQGEVELGERPELTDDQGRAMNKVLQLIRSGEHHTLLIRGVTSSGKTEVYMRAMEEVVRQGRQAIVLVPEISLTPQTCQRFRSRFDEIAVLHSHMTDAERHWHWRRIASGQVSVVIGARSGVFAPTQRLGLIILDEEHESSFKQDSIPRYHARDVARRRAQLENVPLILGSATPCLESWQRAKTGEYSLVSLPNRVFNRPLPDVATIDLRNNSGGRRPPGAISRQLYAAMEVALRDDGQVILLLNRRGFSTHIQCPGCGYVVVCPNCEIALTHHRSDQVAICHYCDYTQKAPTCCPECQFEGIHYGGLGTQRLEAEVAARFRNYKCLRMDSDTMRTRGSHEKALQRFRDGEVHILLGTQMIAKGLDFPRVTLVGVINADTGLHLPDFRAAEKTFQLVTQVAGRSGRGEKGGRVLMQTFTPDHPAIKTAARHNYIAFTEYELPIRKTLGYPPFGAMARIVLRGPSQEQTLATAESLTDKIKQASELFGTSIRILGPAVAPFAKLRGNYRFHMQLQSPRGEALRKVIRAATTDFRPPERVEWIVDIDPLDML